MTDLSGNTKTDILSTALSLFAVKGYQAVGTQEICERSGITKPTLYHHFGSKRGVLEAVVRHWGQPFVQKLTDAAIYGRDLARGLRAIFDLVMSETAANPQFHRLILALYFAPPEAEDGQVVRALHNQIYEIVLNFFKRAEADHGNMKGRAERYALGFLGHVNTWVGLQLGGQNRPDTLMVQKLVHQFMHGIFS